MKDFICPVCDQTHAGPSFYFGANFPDYYFNIPLLEREQRVELTESLCVVDESHFFIRGRIEIPIVDHSEPFIWNIWTSLSEKNFIRTNELWSKEGREEEEPYFGWLQTTLPGYPSTLNIKTLVYTQPVGFIPQVEITEENHPLFTDQQNGITLKEAMQFVEAIFHAE